MARPKAFDKDRAVDAAIDVFRQHGFEGTSTEMLTQAMGIGRQSLYDTYGDKWKLYCIAVERYCDKEASAHISTLRGTVRAVDGIAAMIARVVAEADHACLGVHSVCEFGHGRADLAAIHTWSYRVIASAIAARAAEAQAAGDVSASLAPDDIAAYVMASFSAIRLAARGGAGAAQLDVLGSMTLRALR
ncbi:TetR/AcrR family transcriptional regulator [Cupriavidus pampae]|uniref:HTH-type transcriptional repressor ComR n=1 Tax=Cupriavidus pampae TaxID=659251 RepID=A0ABM8XN71_9BURK|nr:TetR/AcrR family transcriptional regulator [Cupriavidus pampae]CAG9181682.1 HTH-type transcriptional repressor ComR [Cupriavidus pampae]